MSVTMVHLLWMMWRYFRTRRVHLKQSAWRCFSQSHCCEKERKNLSFFLFSPPNTSRRQRNCSLLIPNFLWSQMFNASPQRVHGAAFVGGLMAGGPIKPCLWAPSLEMRTKPKHPYITLTSCCSRATTAIAEKLCLRASLRQHKAHYML